MYRWHVVDPIRFSEDISVEIQALGRRGGQPYLPLHDDLASTAFFYVDAPEVELPPTPTVDELEIS